MTFEKFDRKMILLTLSEKCYFEKKASLNATEVRFKLTFVSNLAAFQNQPFSSSFVKNWTIFFLSLTKSC